MVRDVGVYDVKWHTLYVLKATHQEEGIEISTFTLALWTLSIDALSTHGIMKIMRSTTRNMEITWRSAPNTSCDMFIG